MTLHTTGEDWFNLDAKIQLRHDFWHENELALLLAQSENAYMILYELEPQTSSWKSNGATHISAFASVLQHRLIRDLNPTVDKQWFN